MEISARLRLKLLAGAAFTALGACGGGGSSSTPSAVTPPPPPPPPPPVTEGQLKNRFASNFVVGAAIEASQIAAGSTDAAILASQFSSITAENLMKPYALAPTEGTYTFEQADALVAFAQANGIAMRGHALLWHRATPDYFFQGTPAEVKTRLQKYITDVVTHFKGKIYAWDVVNEVVAHDPLSQGKWRDGIWYRLLGPRHVDLAFAAASNADPTAQLFINDYDLEDDSPRTKARQDAIVSIVRRMQDKNIPVHGVGLQAHLYAERKIGVRNLQDFLKTLVSLGLKVAITEMDVIDWRLPSDTFERDQLAAAKVSEFLSAVTSVVSPEMITTWGMSDIHSWVGETFPRKDDARARPLPFDQDWQPKPMFDVLQPVTG